MLRILSEKVALVSGSSRYRSPIILINLNQERYNLEDILASTIIPGPNKPKELYSFLQPLV